MPCCTAFRSRILEAGFEMGGKTGSAQVRRLSAAERDNNVRRKDAEIPWRERDHALFISFAPIQAPRYACAVVVEHGMGGSRTAAPLTRDILLQTQKIDPSRRPERFKSAMLAGGTVAEAPPPAPDATPKPKRSEP